MHFEIDKDNGGRPAYVFNGCEEVSKGHYEVIQKGYCRVQLFQYTKDPLLLLEQAGATLPVGSDFLPDDHPSAPENEKPIVPELPTPPVLPEKPIEPSQPQPPKPKKNQIALDLSKLDISAKEFTNKRELTMERNFGDALILEQPVQITLTLKNKQTGEPFHGTLNQPLLLIASNTNVDINPVSTVLVSQGIATIHITPKKKGNVYLAVNLGTAKIGGFTVTIQ
ncbi:MAG: hypothetical protein LBI53_06395 [Candidatus Peribacteria bacterium]|nr:hypothetical protein [Candidatus Peribacteria bacterium]